MMISYEFSRAVIPVCNPMIELVKVACCRFFVDYFGDFFTFACVPFYCLAGTMKCFDEFHGSFLRLFFIASMLCILLISMFLVLLN